MIVDYWRSSLTDYPIGLVHSWIVSIKHFNRDPERIVVVGLPYVLSRANFLCQTTMQLLSVTLFRFLASCARVLFNSLLQTNSLSALSVSGRNRLLFPRASLTLESCIQLNRAQDCSPDSGNLRGDSLLQELQLLAIGRQLGHHLTANLRFSCCNRCCSRCSMYRNRATRV